MILYSAAAGSTSNTVYLLAFDRATGAPKTDLVWNTASFSIKYLVTRGLPQTITLATLATADAAWATGGFVVAAGHLYRLDVPNAAFASSDRIYIIPELTDVIFVGVQAIAPAFDPLAAGDTAATITAAIFARAFDATKMSGLTFEQVVGLMATTLLAKASGMETTSAVFRNIGDTANAVAATVDANGNRSAVTLTPGSVA